MGKLQSFVKMLPPVQVRAGSGLAIVFSPICDLGMGVFC